MTRILVVIAIGYYYCCEGNYSDDFACFVKILGTIVMIMVSSATIFYYVVGLIVAIC